MLVQPQLEDSDGVGHPGTEAVANRGRSTQGEQLE